MLGNAVNTVQIRSVDAADEPRWRALWDAYTRFYQREPSEPVTAHTWARIMNPHCPMFAIVAEDGADRVSGMANYVLHENTSTLTPVCYLEDLFVDPADRGHGIGARLIDWLVAEMKRQRWSRLYWNTKEDNYRARALYDRYAKHSGFVRYVLTPDDTNDSIR